MTPDQQTSQVQRNRELAELLARTSLHDQHAFARLYRLTSAKLFGVILRIVYREDLAQECLQEAYIKVWNRSDSYRADRAAAMTWLMTIARNQALDLLRRRRHEMPLEELRQPEQSDTEPQPLEQLQAMNEASALTLCLEQLTQQQRQAVAMAFMRGLTHEQLAGHLDSPLGTVKTWVRRGLEQLKRCLDDEPR